MYGVSGSKSRRTRGSVSRLMRSPAGSGVHAPQLLATLRSISLFAHQSARQGCERRRSTTSFASDAIRAAKSSFCSGSTLPIMKSCHTQMPFASQKS